MENGRLLGLVTLEDNRGLSRHDWKTTTVEEIMTPSEELISVSADEDADDALHKSQQRDVRQLPVLRGDELAGLLRRQDIMR